MSSVTVMGYKITGRKGTSRHCSDLPAQFGNQVGRKGKMPIMTNTPSSDLLGPAWKLVAFDLDDTLAPSKSPLPDQMARALRDLLDVCEVAVISGGAFPQFELQLLGNLHASPAQLANLHLLPTCGTRYANFHEGALVDVYDHQLTEDEAQNAMSALETTARKLGLWCEDPWGEIIENRNSQITFSALGQNAPLDAKRAWDPTGQKRASLAKEVGALLPTLEVRSGGSTSVDITARGIDKAYGMRALVEQTGIAKEDMLFIGDRLDEGGNDYPVKAAGWATLAVEGWEETAEVVEELAASLANRKAERSTSGTPHAAPLGVASATVAP